MQALEPELVSDLTSPAEQNRRVAEAIKAYCVFPYPQGFALMVDGPWGSGKTHLVNSLMDELAERNPLQPLRKPLYVSLYGIRNSSEICEHLYQQLHPVLGHKRTRFAGAVIRGALKGFLKIDLSNDHHGDATLTAQFPALNVSDLVDGAIQRVVIFDDFERSVMTPTEVLGFINPLVEHDDCKVLIITNEEEVGKNEEAYLRRKEKTVGQTLRLKADGGSAFAAFISKVGDARARTYLQSIEQDILAVFKQSELNNLRLLQQFMWVFERLWLTLSETQQEHRDAIRDLAVLLCAAALELLSGRTPGDVFRRADISHFMRLRGKDSEAAVLTDVLIKRYPTVDFDGTLLSPETVREIVLDAAFSVQSVQQQMNGNPLFQPSATIPSWRALWHSKNLGPAELDAVLERFRNDFDGRVFRDVPEILHVAGLSFWLSDLGQPGWDSDRALAQMVAYVNDVYSKEGQVEAGLPTRLPSLSHGAFNLGFVNQEDPRLRKVAEHIEEVLEASRKFSYPTIAAKLQADMTEDSEAFLRDVCFTKPGPARYARAAVLACIPPDEFAATFAASKRQDQENVAMALSIRYDQVPGEPELRSELVWLAEMFECAKRRASKMPPIPRCHFERLLEHNIQKHVQDLVSSELGLTSNLGK